MIGYINSCIARLVATCHRDDIIRVDRGTGYIGSRYKTKKNIFHNTSEDHGHYPLFVTNEVASREKLNLDHRF